MRSLGRLRGRARRRVGAAHRPLAGRLPAGDRLGVVLAQPMDPCGCSNLICGTNTLFYDGLRERKGRRQLLPLRRHVPVRRRLRAGRLQPARRLAAAQVRRRALADRRGPDRDDQRSPHHAARAARDGRALPRRGHPLDLERAPCETVRCVVTYGPRTGRARGGDIGLVGNRVVESYVEQAIFSTPGIGAGEQARLRRLRRSLDREPLRASRSTARSATPPPPARCSASPRCCRRATRRSPAAPRRR